jgi:hypothetical protein
MLETEQGYFYKRKQCGKWLISADWMMLFHKDQVHRSDIQYGGSQPARKLWHLMKVLRLPFLSIFRGSASWRLAG